MSLGIGKNAVPTIPTRTQPELEPSNDHNDNSDDSRSTTQHRILVKLYKYVHIMFQYLLGDLVTLLQLSYFFLANMRPCLNRSYKKFA